MREHIKKLHTIYYLVAALLVLHGCGSAKTAIADQQIVDFKSTIEAKSFEIRANWANPQLSQGLIAIANAGLVQPGSNAGNINLIGNPNYLRFKGDSVSASLPYYGERQISATYNAKNAGIVFDGIPEELSITPTKKGQGYSLSFRIKSDSESYQVTTWVYPTSNAQITVNSSHRTSIRYSGEIVPPAEE